MKYLAATVLPVVISVPLVAWATIELTIGRDRPTLEWSQSKSKIAVANLAVKDYWADHGRYPSAHEGLSVLLGSPPAGRSGPRYLLKYLDAEDDLVDSWGRPLVYASTREGFRGCVIYSLGKDGSAGGLGENRDIVEFCTPRR